MTPELFEHQAEGVPWLQERDHCALFDEPGMGKTLQQLLAATEPVLVTAPAMVIDSGTWDDEIAKFAPGIDLTQSSYHGLVDYVRTNRGGQRPTRRPRSGLTRRWGTVIADESHHLTSRGSKEAYWTEALRHVDTERFRQSTGSPLPNWAHEAFNSLQFCYPEEAKAGRRLGSYWRWVAEWFHVGPTLWQHRAVGQFKDEEHLSRCHECEGPARTWEEFRTVNWGDRVLMRLRDDCLDLPPLTIQEWKVHMGKQQARVYKALQKDFVAWLDDGTELAAWNSADQSNKLLQAATGLEVVSPGSKGSAKLDALREILKSRSRPTLVVGYFRRTVAECAKAAAQVGMEAMVIDGNTTRLRRREATKAFQSGSLPVLCATIDTIREGLNLQGADQAVRVEKAWLPSRNDQVAFRLSRIGQERPVLVIDLLTVGTADYRKERILADKDDQQVKALGKKALLRLATGT